MNQLNNLAHVDSDSDSTKSEEPDNKLIDYLQKNLMKRKINLKNVFDYEMPKITELFKDDTQNQHWGKMASTLSIEAQLYGIRVDSLAQESKIIVNGLSIN